ncbi:MAG TPA: hypothetical protein VF105_02710 [Gemmatimonadaceae bacterium]
MVPDTRISLGQILQVVVLVSIANCAACDGDDTGGPPEPPPQTDAPIASVEILPALISVQRGTSFVLRARVKDQWGNILPDERASVVRWTTSGEFPVPPGPSATVTVTATPTAPLPLDVYLIASVPGVEKKDTSTIRVTAPPEANDRDWIAGEYSANAEPSFAFVTGHSNYGEAGDRINSLVPFVKEGALEPLDCDLGPTQCGVITLISPRRAITQTPASWISACDFASFVSAAGPPAGCTSVKPTIPTPLKSPPKISVALWQLAEVPGIANQIAGDKAYAESVFDQPYIGLQLDIQLRPYANKHTSITRGLGCKTTDGTPLTTEFGNWGVKYDPKVVTAVYVDGINPGAGDDVGFTCPYDDAGGTGVLVVISGNAISNSTLAHELGHAFGQWQWGDRSHPDFPAPHLPGFDPSNLMWSSESDWYVSLRRNLTLGQLFQMSLASRSFLQKSAPASPLNCPADPSSSSPCPRLAQDQRQ